MFVLKCLLSHKYGNIFLPERIESEEFKKIHLEISSDPKINDVLNENLILKLANQTVKNNLDLLQFCYELDNNSIPARYRLKSLDKIIKDYDDSLDYSTSQHVLDIVGSLMRAGADALKNKKMLTDMEHDRYFVSVTEKEIFEGLITAKNLSNNVLLFKRNITDIDEALKEAVNSGADKSKKIAKLKRYVDLNSDNRIDTETRNRLEKLKNTKIVQCEGMKSEGNEKNIFEFDVTF